MQLIIKRGQEDWLGKEKRSLLGRPSPGEHIGVFYSLFLKVILTHEERALVDRHLLKNRTMLEWEGNELRPVLEKPGSEVTLHDLTMGVSLKTVVVSQALSIENNVRQACHNLKSVIQASRDFGGEETVEI